MNEIPEREAALDALRCQLFDALGYVFGWDTASSPRVFRLIMPDGREDTTRHERYIVGVLSRAGVADWPRDVAAAMALCLEMGSPYHTRGVVVQYDPGDPEVGAPDGYSARWDDDHGYAEFAPTPAEALARLALEALQGGGDD